MYLKRMEIKGFKSFADTTEMIYNSGVTCVVGPNGSGKSNITDAVRWVLGEQKVKTLRGSKMEDVIFNGTKHRKPLGLAEVSLIFDNSQRFFDVDYGEVVITRRLYRSGDSEYLINGSACRLKDVRDLFVDTGMGTEGYSIIGQGRIDRILSHNPSDRRIIFEEVAGIVKYKNRKIEAQRKLDSAQANMFRVQDIIDELEMRVEPLKIESDKAQEYLKYEKERKHLQIGHFIRIIDKYDNDLKKENAFKLNIQNEIKIIEDNEKIWEKDIENLDLELVNLDNDLSNADKQILNLTESLGHIEAKAIQIEEKEKYIAENQERYISQKKILEDDINNFNQNCEIVYKKQFELSEVVENYRSKIQEIKSFYEKTIENVAKAQIEVDEDKKKVIGILNQIEEYKLEIARNESSLESWLQRKEDTIKKSDEIDEKYIEIDNSLQDTLEKLSDSNNNKNDCLNKRNQNEKQREYLVKNKLGYEDELKNIINKIFESKKEKQLLEDMESSFEGYEYSVKTLLKACSKDVNLGKGVHGVVAGILEVPKLLENSIEIILGRQLQQIVTDDEQDVKRLISYLKKNKIGRVTFLPLSNLKPRELELPKEIGNIDGVIGIAHEQVGCAKGYENLVKYLLCRTLIVKNYDVAVKCIKLKGMKHRIVTLDGEVLIVGGSISGGISKNKTSHILGRKRRIDELDKLIENNLISKYEKEKNIDDIKIEILSIEEKIVDINNSFQVLERDILRLESSYKQIEDEKKKLNYDSEQLDIQKDMIFNQINQITKNLTLSKESIEKLQIDKDVISSKIQDEHDVVNQLESEMANVQKQLSEIEIQEAKISEQYDYSKIEYNRLKQNLDNKINELKSLEILQIKEQEEKNMLAGQKKETNEKKNTFENNLSELKNSKIKYQQLKNKIQEKYAVKKTEYDKSLKKREENREKLHNQEIILTKIEAKKEGIISNLWEMYEMSLLEARKHRVEMEEKELKSRLNSIQRSIKSLGEVNVAAIEEYKAVKERLDFMTGQRDDLLSAEKSLKSVIKDMENEMTHRFMETFKIVKTNFNDIFHNLFSGGSSDIILQEGEDCLSAGIEILAQPAGKKLQSLDLLSGGERAMTAIALLFAILKTRPTPFCILDEIEAALDDVNVYKFANFLKGFVQNSQFVIITHRKGTMEIADTMYGVTMEEYGVSKLVSVKLDDYREAEYA